MRWSSSLANSQIADHDDWDIRLLAFHAPQPVQKSAFRCGRGTKLQMHGDAAQMPATSSCKTMLLARLCATTSCEQLATRAMTDRRTPTTTPPRRLLNSVSSLVSNMLAKKAVSRRKKPEVYRGSPALLQANHIRSPAPPLDNLVSGPPDPAPSVHPPRDKEFTIHAKTVRGNKGSAQGNGCKRPARLVAATWLAPGHARLWPPSPPLRPQVPSTGAAPPAECSCAAP